MNAINVNALVVEDNLHMLRIITAIVKGIGIKNVCATQDPLLALEIFKTSPVDLIFLDREMPGMDGIEFTQQVRTSINSPNQFVPIIMITAYTERSSIIEARDAGVTEICGKPITASALHKRIVSVVNRNRSFVRTSQFFGPCRRRKVDDLYRGPERRDEAHTQAHNSMR